MNQIQPDNKLGAYSRTSTFVKVQDGYDNVCSFCVTASAAGAGRSRPLNRSCDRNPLLHAIGYQEAIIPGVQLGSYGHDLGLGEGLVELVKTILTPKPIYRVCVSHRWNPGFIGGHSFQLVEIRSMPSSAFAP